ncbi:MAG: hypothetical protein NZ900_01425 [Synergistetes bacterium]|nr:hypothetical protein [Synergistota bacterium]MDW8191587.1 hypothetical protein [Synergistota bacterium]
MKKIVSLGLMLVASLLMAAFAFAAGPTVTVSPDKVDLKEVAVGGTVSASVNFTFTPKDLTEEVVIELAPADVTEGWKLEAKGSVTLKPGDAPKTLTVEVKATATDKAKGDLNAKINLVVKKGKATVKPAAIAVVAKLKK